MTIVKGPILVLWTMLVTAPVVESSLMNANAFNNLQGISDEIMIEDFSNPKLKWETLNDPVMGGLSYGNLTIEEGVAKFRGEVVDVPSLKAPGFITMENRGGVYPDLSTCDSLKIVLRSNEEYGGYRISFGAEHPDGALYASGFKAALDAPAQNVFSTSILPFSAFSDKWDAKTGDIEVSCREDPKYCVDKQTLQNLQTVSIWGEGVAGKIDLVIKSISAIGCAEGTYSEGNYLDFLSTEITAAEAAESNRAEILSKESGVSGEILLEGFANDSPLNTWKQMNDPVMGGQSTGTFKVESGVGIMSGFVNIVPFLQAPGFIKAETAEAKYPDISSCKGLRIRASTRGAYSGYRLSFGHEHPPNMMRHAHGYKTNLIFSASDGMEDIEFKWEDFSDDWDPSTGDQLTTCQENADYCPSLDALKNIYSIALWAEGVVGDVYLALESIHAIGCDADNSIHNTADNIVNNADEIMIEDFSKPMLKWDALNDPVMGGQSYGSVKIEDGVAAFEGEVVDVPFLQAPGFITMENRAGIYPDVSSCSSLKLTLRANEEYSGYRVSFGTAHVDGGRYASGFKTPFDAPVQENFSSVVLPFSSFSDDWDDATGDIKVSCEEDAQYCVDDETLKNFQTMSIWGEGVAGKVDLVIQSISAVGCAGNEISDPLPIGPNNIDTTASSIVVTPSTESAKASSFVPAHKEAGDEILLEGFMQDRSMNVWTQMNDPVMGGQSTGTFKVESDVGIMSGVVKIVPFLQAPGFIKVETTEAKYPDISSCKGLRIRASTRGAYSGYRVSFGHEHPPNAFPYSYGYKTNLVFSQSDEMEDIEFKWENFSDDWDEATGDQRTTCQENADYCPSLDALKDIYSIALWAEGVEGDVYLALESIHATGCDADNKNTITEKSTSSSSELLTTISSGSSSNIVRSANSESSTDNVPSSAKFGLLAVGGFLAMALALLFRSHQGAIHTKDYEEVTAEVELSEVRFEKEIV